MAGIILTPEEKKRLLETPDKELTAKEVQLKKLAKLRDRAADLEKGLKKDSQKKRNDYLIMFGLLVEILYKKANDNEKTDWINKANAELKDRNLIRIMAGFEELGLPEKEEKPDSF